MLRLQVRALFGLPFLKENKMIEPTTADIGRAVLYGPKYGQPLEEGVITSFNNVFVFVRYGTDKHSKATLREDLRWIRKMK